MHIVVTVALLAGLAVSSAQAQYVDGVPVGPGRGDSVPPARPVQFQLMAAIPVLRCPMPVSHGITGDSAAVVRPQEHSVPSQKPVAIPTQRANCVNPMFVSGADR